MTVPLLVVTLWRPPVFGCEDLGYQQCGADFYEKGMGEEMGDKRICPHCGIEVFDLDGEVAHMETMHPDVIRQRLIDAGMHTEAEEIDPNIHVDKDDPRYKGFRIRQYWLATAVAPDDMEAPLAVSMWQAVEFEIPPGFAFAADQRRLVRMRKFAQSVADKHQVEVRIRRFLPVGEDEVITATKKEDE